VCDENFGSGTLTDNTQARPSRMSSPVVSTFAFLAISFSSMYLLSARVIAARSPVRCVPPSFCGMLLGEQRKFSWWESFHSVAASHVVPTFTAWSETRVGGKPLVPG